MAVVNANKFNFSEVVQKYLTAYGQAATAAMYRAIDDVSEEALDKLRAQSKATFNGKKYWRNWTKKTDRGRTKNYVVIYGRAPTYRLAHLLEHGHVSSNGTRRTFSPPVPGREHIAPVAEWATDEAIDRTIRYMEKANF